MSKKDDDLGFPVLRGTLEQKVETLVDWIDEHVSRTRWSDEKIDDNFGRRSTRQILSDGEACYMNPCADLTLVAYAIMRRNGINPTMIVEELAPGDYPFVRLHFGLEFSYDNRNYFLDFIQLNKVLLGDGEFVNHKKDIVATKLSRISSDITIDDNPINIVLREAKPKDFDLNSQLERLKKDNTPQTYEKYLASMPNGGRLYLEKI